MDDLERSVAYLQLMDREISAMQSQSEIMSSHLRSYQTAISTLEITASLERGYELLIPVGGNALIRARIDDPDTVLIEVGAGIYLEYSAQKATDVLKKRKDEVQEAMKQLSERLGTLVRQRNAVAQRVRAQYEAMRVVQGTEGKVEQGQD